MRKSHLIIPSLALLGIGLLSSCDSDSSTSSNGGSSASSLVGTWVRIDSNFTISDNGDTTYSSDQDNVDHDTTYWTFSENGQRQEIQHIWYKVRSIGSIIQELHIFPGTWNISGSQLTMTTTYPDGVSTGTASYSIIGSKLVLTKGGKSIVFDRHSDQIVIPTTGSGAGTSTTVASSPTFSPASGTYTSAQTVFLSSAATGATIYYTTDGSTPTTSSLVYSSAITVSASMTLKAIAVRNGVASSVGSATYTFTGDLTAVKDQGAFDAGAQNTTNVGSFISVRGDAGDPSGFVLSGYDMAAADEASIDLCFFAMTNGAKALTGTPTIASPKLIQPSLPSWTTTNKTIIVKTTKVASSFKTVQDIKDVIGSSTSESAPAVTGGVYAVKMSDGKYAVLSVTALVGSTATSTVSFRIIK